MEVRYEVREISATRKKGKSTPSCLWKVGRREMGQEVSHGCWQTHVFQDETWRQRAKVFRWVWRNSRILHLVAHFPEHSLRKVAALGKALHLARQHTLNGREWEGSPEQGSCQAL